MAAAAEDLVELKVLLSLWLWKPVVEFTLPCYNYLEKQTPLSEQPFHFPSDTVEITDV